MSTNIHKPERLLLTVTTATLKWLQKMSKELGVPVQDAIRRILDEKRLGSAFGTETKND